MKTFIPLLAALVAIATALPAGAQTVSPVPAPTIITTAPYTITKAGYYQLGADLVYAGTGASNDAIITIGASNVTLDFAGHYISGPSNNTGTQLYGVYANEEGNLTIRNGTVAFCYIGIDLVGNDNAATTLNINQQVDNMLITHIYGYGMNLFGVFGGAITNTRVTSTGTSTNVIGAIAIQVSGDNNKILNNTISGVTTNATGGSTFGIGGGNVVSNNFIENITAPTGGSGSKAYGIYNSGAVSNNIISTITATTSYGIYGATFSLGNLITNAQTGIYSGGKYKDNLTSGCTTPFSGGTAVGTNN